MNITFTGIDEYTDLSKLSTLAEYGILLSLHNTTIRYPSLEKIEQISNELKNKNYNLSLHVCGSEAKEKLINKEISFIDNFKRIQVNGKMKISKCKLIADLYPQHEIIFQYNELNKELPESLKDYKNISFLVDNSGGKGISPNKWENPFKELKFGYAGGLGLDNIQEESIKINSIGSKDFWIDMEGKIRTEDKFDVEIVNQILKVIENNTKIFAFTNILDNFENELKI